MTDNIRKGRPSVTIERVFNYQYPDYRYLFEFLFERSEYRTSPQPTNFKLLRIVFCKKHGLTTSYEKIPKKFEKIIDGYSKLLDTMMPRRSSLLKT